MQLCEHTAMKRVVSSGAAIALLLSAACVRAAESTDDAVFHQRAAACVAVMKSDVERLVPRFRAGEAALRPDLERLTAQGYAFIGTAYLRGLRKAEADRMLAQAEAQQRQQAPEALRLLSTACQAEGAALLANANGLERALVNNRARARVDKLLK